MALRIGVCVAQHPRAVRFGSLADIRTELARRPPYPRKRRWHYEYAHRLLLQAVGLPDQSMPVAYSVLPSAADCPCHAIYAGCAEFCQMRLQTSFNSAAARLHASAHSSDVAAAFTRNCRRPDQYSLARAGEVGQMRVKAGPDVARARRHVSTRRPDISGTHPYDLSLLRHCVRCREQHNGTDCNNSLSHRLSPFVLTNYVQ